MPNCNYEAIEKYKIEIEKTSIKLYSEIFDAMPATIVHLFGSNYKKQIYENRVKELIEPYNEYNILLKEH